MAEDIRLSRRLLKVASYLPTGANFADIGSDHAYLPCYVCKKDPEARAIAGEVNEGPLASARETINLYALDKVVDARLGDGLSVLQHDEVNQVVIAGMGGSLIRSILESGKEKLGKVSIIIAQPNIDEKNVRSWYLENGFSINDEAILEENGHIYEIVVGERRQATDQLTERELLFGPVLLEERNPLFYKKWHSEYEKLGRIINQMKNAKVQDISKINKFEEQLEWIKEVLEDGPNN
jgi:tRNA (adenine22-N1)-methyltransferase